MADKNIPRVVVVVQFHRRSNITGARAREASAVHAVILLYFTSRRANYGTKLAFTTRLACTSLSLVSLASAPWKSAAVLQLGRLRCDVNIAR